MCVGHDLIVGDVTKSQNSRPKVQPAGSVMGRVSFLVQFPTLFPREYLKPCAHPVHHSWVQLSSPSQRYISVSKGKGTKMHQTQSRSICRFQRGRHRGRSQPGIALGVFPMGCAEIVAGGFPYGCTQCSVFSQLINAGTPSC